MHTFTFGCSKNKGHKVVSVNHLVYNLRSLDWVSNVDMDTHVRNKLGKKSIGIGGVLRTFIFICLYLCSFVRHDKIFSALF